jgi:long-subunit acyl-CoA synthetase (AMP-forming)
MLPKIEKMNLSKVNYIIYNTTFPHEPEKIDNLFFSEEKKQKKNYNPKLKVISFQEIEKLGEDEIENDLKKKKIVDDEKRKPKKDDVLLIMYTSGTTGKFIT